MITKKVSVMILAAGYGKRMRPITANIPKPLVKVAGKTLLQNLLDLVLQLNCKEIIVNTHYKHQMIYDFIKNNYDSKAVVISYEKKLLDTGGGVKNALPLFTNNEVLILNSDIFWMPDNFQDIKNLIQNYKTEQRCKLLLVSQEKAHGMYNDKGDFIIYKGLVKRYKRNQKIYFYSGAQIISLDVLAKYKKESFSFNLVWDQLINNQLVFGEVMKSDWYHIGNIKGLKEVENLIT